jgi:inhibitor of KinA
MTLQVDAGEAALVAQFGDSVDPAINDRVLALDAALRADPPLGTREFVPTFRSLMIHYDPLKIDRETLVAMVRRGMGAVVEERRPATTWTLPCCYDPALAEDLDESADSWANAG